MPPDLRTFGSAPFGDPQRTRLTGWLHEGGWPRGHMNIAELEGYLVALIAWPVGISAGAWLPPIWSERGWKVSAKIAARLRYDEFVALIIGFMQDLDRELSRQPTRFESSVLRNLNDDARTEALHSWGRGFMTALTLGSQGFKWRSASAGDAVRHIAGSTSASAPSDPNAVEGIVNAVLTLMEQRPSRGPLGPLAIVGPPETPFGCTTPAAGENPRKSGRRPT
jgi:yecA family protein